ncbi:AMP-dependent synthetase/ligase [Trichoderma velutinum]
MLCPSAESIAEYLQFVRTHSPFYRDLWADVPEGVSDLSLLPVTDNDQYWANATVENNRVLTAPVIDGGIFTSGGTTGAPKAVHVTHDELRRGCKMLASAMSHRSGVIPGDRVANLTWAGNLYGAFPLQLLSLVEMSTPHVQLPITGGIKPESIAVSMQIFKATVIMSNIFTVVRVADYLIEKGETLPSLRLILYTGESFYEDLRSVFARAFPNARVGPLMYVSVDGGVIGLPIKPPSSPEDATKPIYQANVPTVVLELLDDDGNVIRENGKRGHVHLTDLVRRLQPVVRYPTGDLAEWTDYDNSLFHLVGRGTVALKVGRLFLSMMLLRSVVGKTLGDTAINTFQVVTRRTNTRTQVTFRIAHFPEDKGDAKKRLEQNLIAMSPTWGEYLESNYVWPLEVEWVDLKDLIFNDRTGKLKEIIEERFTEE